MWWANRITRRFVCNATIGYRWQKEDSDIPRLEARLALIKEWCRPFRVIADIGAGYGHLAKALAREHHRVYAIEYPRGAYLDLLQGIEGCLGITPLQGDGLTPLGDRPIDVAVIAGMGPNSIRHIMQRRYSLPFIIQPMQGIFRVHRQLVEDGWSIQKAQLIDQGGRLYATWLVGQSGIDGQNKRLVPDEFCQDPLFPRLVEQRIRELQKRLTASVTPPGASWDEELQQLKALQLC